MEGDGIGCGVGDFEVGLGGETGGGGVEGVGAGVGEGELAGAFRVGLAGVGLAGLVVGGIDLDGGGGEALRVEGADG